MRLKKVSEQVIVITGASSGIGRATALLAAKRGAAVVLTARSAELRLSSAPQGRARSGRKRPVAIPAAEQAQIVVRPAHAVLRHLPGGEQSVDVIRVQRKLLVHQLRLIEPHSVLLRIGGMAAAGRAALQRIEHQSRQGAEARLPGWERIPAGQALGLGCSAASEQAERAGHSQPRALSAGRRWHDISLHSSRNRNSALARRARNAASPA
ncbi:MAG TPA: SDR family NAD(P)-dependent oxidoreductase [Polyangiaceae bacterium]|nr:SDR family NAD(P)-dependent oxidoreductase [Polyangiaceae bacterium]